MAFERLYWPFKWIFLGAVKYMNLRPKEGPGPGSSTGAIHNSSLKLWSMVELTLKKYDT